MHLRHAPIRTAAWLMVALLSLTLAGCGKDPGTEGDSSGNTGAGKLPQSTSKNETPRYFSDSVVKAWEQAGAEAGWIRQDNKGDLWFRTGTKEGYGVGPNLANDLPAFRLERWADGALAPLPVPASGFALDVHSARVTDAKLKELAGMKSLRSLNLDNTRVSDAGIAELTGLGNLRAMNLHNTNLTDAGLKELAKIKSLKWVNLNGVRVTSSALFELKQALPGCTIYRRN